MDLVSLYKKYRIISLVYFHLKNIKAKRVSKQGQNQKSGDGELAPARWSPIEKKRSGRRRGEGAVHGEGAVASETDVMPCSSAVLATCTTSSYGVKRSARIMIELL